MVKYQDATLDRTFAALADPTRRALLARLQARDTLSVSELAQPFAMSLPAVMKHLDVLTDAGLIAREKTGRVGGLPPDRETDGAGDGMAQSLPALLVRQSRSSCRLCGGGCLMAQSATATELAARPSLTLTRRLRARPEKVYAAWADPLNLVQWFALSQAKPGSLKAELDVRVGGCYRISFTDAKGEYFEVGGVYREVVPNERLKFTWTLAFDAGAGVAGDGAAEARRRRHAADLPSRAVHR